MKNCKTEAANLELEENKDVLLNFIPNEERGVRNVCLLFCVNEDGTPEEDSEEEKANEFNFRRRFWR